MVGPALLPMNRLNRSIRLALSAFADNAVRYEDPRGSLRLRRQIARLVFRQGATCSPDDVLVTSGETEALNLCLRAVAKPGDVVAVESPGCYEILQALRGVPHARGGDAARARHEGMDLAPAGGGGPEAPRQGDRGRDATCHNPFGDCVSDESKAELVAFATRHDLPLIEGDPFGDLVYSGERPRPLKAFDKTGIVLQCSSLAHYVAPGFNIGWASGGRWQAEVERLKGIHERRRRAAAAARAWPSSSSRAPSRSTSSSCGSRCGSSVEASRAGDAARRSRRARASAGREGGFVLWVQLPDGYDGVERPAPGGRGRRPHPRRARCSRRRGNTRHCIRISCGHPFEVIRPALRTLARLLKR